MGKIMTPQDLEDLKKEILNELEDQCVLPDYCYVQIREIINAQFTAYLERFKAGQCLHGESCFECEGRKPREVKTPKAPDLSILKIPEAGAENVDVKECSPGKPHPECQLCSAIAKPTVDGELIERVARAAWNEWLQFPTKGEKPLEQWERIAIAAIAAMQPPTKGDL